MIGIQSTYSCISQVRKKNGLEEWIEKNGLRTFQKDQTLRIQLLQERSPSKWNGRR